MPQWCVCALKRRGTGWWVVKQWGGQDSVWELCLSTVTLILLAVTFAVGKIGIKVFVPFPVLKGWKDKHVRTQNL